MRKRICHIGLAAVLVAVPCSPAFAGEDNQLWTGANASVKLGPKWQVSEELISRFSRNRSGLYEIEAVTMLGYKLGPTVTVGAGYVHNPQYSDGDFTVLERRAREQVTFDNVARFAGGKLSLRARLEQRWRENVDGTGWRLRPYAKFSRPLTKDGKTALVVSSEPFINLSTAGFQRTQGFDRMRNGIAVNRRLSPRLGVEGGYLNQYGFVRDGDDTVDHVATVALSLSL